MLDLIAIAQSAPGAIAVNGAIVVGFKLAGVLGAVTVIVATIIPPFLIITVISYFYELFRDNYIVSSVLSGMQAGVGAVIASVVLDMGGGSGAGGLVAAQAAQAAGGAVSELVLADINPRALEFASANAALAAAAAARWRTSGLSERRMRRAVLVLCGTHTAAHQTPVLLHAPTWAHTLCRWRRPQTCPPADGLRCIQRSKPAENPARFFPHRF